MKRPSKANVALGVLAAGMALGAVLPAAAQCPKLSNVEWWTNTESEVRSVVVASYGGNWNAYISRWRQQRDDLQKAFDTQNAVEIKSRGLIFRGDDLKDYIRLVDERIAALECLKTEYGNESQAGAKGEAESQRAQPPPQQLGPPANVAAVEGQELSVEIAALCHEGTPAFQVTNLGDRWPRLGEVSLYRTDTNAMLTQRRVRMVNSQQLLFKIPSDQAKDAGEVGIFIEPSWYARKFAYDAKVKCR